MTSFMRRCAGAAHCLGWLYVAALIGLTVQHGLLPQRNGLLALTQVFAPYLFLPLVVVVPLALWLRRSPLLPAAGIICVLIAGLRFLPTWLSLPPQETPNALRFSAATWNMYVANRNLGELPQTVVNAQADVLAIQELTPGHRSALENNPTIAERYPWRYLQPGESDGMGILSRFPIVEQGILHNRDRPESFPILWARLDLGAGRRLVVVTAHPRAPRTPFRSRVPVPQTFDADGREADIAYLRAFIDPILRNAEPLLLLGDFNLTEREPAYRKAAAGLLDAHAEVGFGSGNTWIIAPLRQINAGLLRIDYLFSSPRVAPLQTAVDCATRGSDHCLVRGLFELHE